MDASTGSSFADIPTPSSSQPSLIDFPSEASGRGHHAEDEEILDDLPSPSVSDSDEVTISDDNDYNGHGESDAEREWKESVEQLELMLSMVIVPYLGKYFGRKFAYWGWKQYMEWKYPVEIVVTNKAAFKGAGVVGAAAAL